ncbi:hypothetical protein AOLI_G00006360 [Acnodon oligacanthus]
MRLWLAGGLVWKKQSAEDHWATEKAILEQNRQSPLINSTNRTVYDPELGKKYQQCRTAVWKTLACQWQTWPVVVVAVALLALVPYAVVRMLTAFQNPPPHALFRTAAICFGLLTETLLIRCLFCYVSGRYRQAEQSSFSLQPRGLEEEQEDLAVNSHGQQPEAGEGSQERGTNGVQRNPLWPWKSRPAVRKEKHIDLQ